MGAASDCQTKRSWGKSMSLRSFKRAQARRVEREQRRAQLLARRGTRVAGATLGATMLMAASAQASTWTVNTTNDSNDGSCTPDLCSLRDAVNAASSDSSAPTIVFDNSLSGQTIALSSEYGPLYIHNNSYGVTIDGSSLANPVTVDGQDSTQIFRVTGGSSSNTNTIKGIDITHGASGSAPGGAVGNPTTVP